VRASAATDIQLPPSDAKQSFPQISERDRVASNSGNPHVASTLVLANNTLFPGNYLPTDPQSPDSVVYDNATGEFFIADYYSASVTVINASTEEIISDIAVGNTPIWLTYDQGKGEIFVVNFGSNTVSVISDTSDAVIDTISVWYQPSGAAYDPETGIVYVANSNAYASPPTIGNVSEISDSNNVVVGNISVGEYPTEIAVDSAAQELFVTNEGSDNVSVLSGTTNKVVATVAVGDEPTGAAYDPALSELFVSNSGSQDVGNLTVVDVLTNSTVASIPVGGAPEGVLYDNVSNLVYVTNYGTSNVSAVNPSNSRVVANIPVGQNPIGLGLDYELGSIWVANTDSNDLTIISDSTDVVLGSVWLNSYPSSEAYDSGRSEMLVAIPEANIFDIVPDSTQSVVESVPVGSNPEALAYDNVTGTFLAANYNSADVSVISDHSNSSIAQVPVRSGPDGLAADPITGDVYVSDLNSNNITVISGQTSSVDGNISVGAGPDGIVSDPEAGAVYVADSETDRVDVISTQSASVTATVSTGSSPVAVAYDNGTGEIFVANFDSSTVSVVSDSSNTVMATIPVGSHPSALAYDPSEGEVFVTNEYSNNVSVISDTSDTVIATVSVQHAPAAATYDSGDGEIYVANSGAGTISILSTDLGAYNGVEFSESGLPVGTTWSVTMNNTTASSLARQITFIETNGSYDFQVGAVSGYTAAPTTGSLTVQGGVVHRLIKFKPVTPEMFLVKVVESGLPVGTKWSISLNGTPESSTTGTIGFNEPNGTFRYVVVPVPGFIASPNAGQLGVVGAAATLQVNFSLRAPYTVTFQESGLPTPPSWGVTLAGASETTNGSTIEIAERNGTYNFSVWGSPGFQPSPAIGSVFVNGSNDSVSIGFTRSIIAYPVTVTESGLPGGTSWTARVDNNSTSSTSDVIRWDEPNGSYELNVTGPYGYSVNFSGAFQVAGSPLNLTVQFENESGLVTLYESGLPSDSEWEVSLVLVNSQQSTVGHSNASEIALWLAIGTYSVLASGPTGDSISISNGVVVVSTGHVGVVYVSFNPLQPTGSSREGTLWYLPWVGGTIAVLAILGGAAGYLSYRTARSRVEGERWVREIETDAHGTVRDRDR
jgi:YVTN family beta-propeller protein